MQAKAERFELRLEQSTLNKIDAWRGETAEYPSRAEAIRRLVDAGLASSTERQAYVAMKLHVLSAGLMSEKQLLPDAYLYAWERDVYPSHHEAADWHGPFAEYFRVSKEMIEELAGNLADKWDEKEVPTFYDLEDYYEIRSGKGSWDRGLLLSACRYLYLNELFDTEFWNQLLTPMKHPAEARSITRKYDRDEVLLA